MIGTQSLLELINLLKKKFYLKERVGNQNLKLLIASKS